MPSTHQVAHFNLATARQALDHPAMADFVAQLEPVNQLARTSPGFVWTPEPDEAERDAAAVFGSDRLLPNLSVWRSLEELRRFVYDGLHGRVLERKGDWFETPAGPWYVLWWIPAGHRPDFAEGRGRLEYLAAHGPTFYAFTFAHPFGASDSTT